MGLKFCCCIWLSIEDVVKTFDRGDEEEVDAEEIRQLLDEDDKGGKS